MEWLLTPKALRTPSSQAKYAESIGVVEQTLRNWRRNPAFRAEWDERMKKRQESPERAQEVMDSLFSRALEGDNKAAELYLRVTGRLVAAPIKVEQEKPKLVDLSDEELDRLISDRARTERAERLGNASAS